MGAKYPDSLCDCSFTYFIFKLPFESSNVFPEALADVGMGLACSTGNASSVL